MNNEKSPRIKLIPLGILWATVFVSFVFTLLTDYTLGISVLHASLLLIICSFGFICNKKFYRYTMFLTLVLGTVGLVEFSFYEITIALGYEGVGSLAVHLLPTLILLFFIYVHQDQIRNTFFSSSVDSKQDYDAKLKRVKTFKSRF